MATAVVENQRQLFRIPDDVTYLNCAYMSPQLVAVEEAGLEAVKRKSSPWDIATEDFFEDSERARSLFARLIGAQADDVALIPSVSYGIATAARNILVGAGEKIVVLAEQFPSNYYMWKVLAEQRGAALRTLAVPADGNWTAALREALTEDVALVAIPQVHWTDGSCIDLEAVGQRCRQIASALVLDLTQSLGAMPFDVSGVEPDFIVSAAYKWLLGPYSCGFLYAHPRHHDGTPLEEGWIARSNSRDFAALVNYSDRYHAGARRFDMGERSNFVLLPMAIRALEQVLGWGVENIAATLGRLNTYLAERAVDAGFEVIASGYKAPHLTGLKVATQDPRALLEALRHAGVYVSLRGASVRVSPYLYNGNSDIDRLIEVLGAECPAV
jgi:selenocysteine lyase/cysteine desulfurase